MRARAAAFYQELRARRSVRSFSPKPVPREAIADAIRAAGTAPSGANLQPWRFVVVGDPATKRRIREAAEAEERAFYGGRAPEEWLAALAPLGTDADKPFLEIAPYLIAIFAESHGLAADGARTKHYYVQESVGIATGFLIAALHHAGLATLTHTPSPMGFLSKLLGRPAHERPYLLLVVGYPAEGAQVPTLRKKELDEIAVFL
ncbi:MAG: nitroreductase family protein [Myxococcales bacterium]|nr:nitroreductase family protein [Myxococcales bacterium]